MPQHIESRRRDAGRPATDRTATDRTATDRNAFRADVIRADLFRADVTRYRTEDPRSEHGAAAASTVLRALLPLRLFLGATFLYAGLDKVLDPTFLRDSGPGSIGAQLVGFTHASPLTPLIQSFALPAPVLVGWLMAVAEIAIGLGALLGLLYRAAALGGAAIALLFWLTASWTTRPYYYGPDLPYAAGWITLALVGMPGPLAADSWFAAAAARVRAAFEPGFRAGHRRRDVVEPTALEQLVPVSPGRRAILKGAVLGGAAFAVAGAAGVFGALRGQDDQTGLAGDGGSTADSGTPASSAAADPPTAPAAATEPTPGATSVAPSVPANVIARLDQIQPRHALSFQDPSTGDPAVLVRLADGKFVAYDAVCTHAGCTVGYDTGSSLLLCPCHGAAFDPANQAAVVGGPTDQPLAALPIKIDQKTGTILLAG